MQGAAEPNERRDLGRTAARLHVAIFVNQRLLAMIELAQRRPIDLAPEQRLGIEFAAPGLRRPLQLPDRHAILVEDAQLQLVDDRAVGCAGLMHGQAKIAAGRRAPPETVGSSVAGLDAAHLAKALAVVGKMRREYGSVSVSPFDQGAERRSYGAEVDRKALADGNFHRSAAQRGEAARLANRCGLLGSVEVDLDDFRPALGRRVVARPADESRFDRGECEYVLSALAVARAAEIAPLLAVEGRREAIFHRRAVAPIDLQTAKRGDRPEINLEERPVDRFRHPRGRVTLVDGAPRIAAAGGCSPLALGRNFHGELLLKSRPRCNRGR